MLSKYGFFGAAIQSERVGGEARGRLVHFWHSSIFFERVLHARSGAREAILSDSTECVCPRGVCENSFLCKTVKSRYDGTVRPLAEKTSGLPPLGLAPPFSAFLIAPRHTLSAFFTAASALPSSSANRPHSIRAS